MLYTALPALIAAMLAYMFWHAGYRLRRERIENERSRRRSRLRVERVPKKR
jgi:Na+/H+ antiporter NhaC